MNNPTANRHLVATGTAIPTPRTRYSGGKAIEEHGSVGGKRIVGSGDSWFRTHLTVGRRIA